MTDSSFSREYGVDVIYHGMVTRSGNEVEYRVSVEHFHLVLINNNYLTAKG